MPITLNNIFRYGKNSFRIMDRLKRLEEEGVEEIYVRRGLYISIKRLKKILYEYSKDGYSLEEIELFIRVYDV